MFHTVIPEEQLEKPSVKTSSVISLSSCSFIDFTGISLSTNKQTALLLQWKSLKAFSLSDAVNPDVSLSESLGRGVWAGGGLGEGWGRGGG